MCKYTENIEKHTLKPKLFTQSRTKPNHKNDQNPQSNSQQQSSIKQLLWVKLCAITLEIRRKVKVIYGILQSNIWYITE